MQSNFSRSPEIVQQLHNLRNIPGKGYYKAILFLNKDLDSAQMIPSGIRSLLTGRIFCGIFVIARIDRDAVLLKRPKRLASQPGSLRC